MNPARISSGGDRRVRVARTVTAVDGAVYYFGDNSNPLANMPANRRVGERRKAHERREQANRAIEMALKDGDTYLIQIVSGGVLALRSAAGVVVADRIAKLESVIEAADRMREAMGAYWDSPCLAYYDAIDKAIAFYGAARAELKP